MSEARTTQAVIHLSINAPDAKTLPVLVDVRDADNPIINYSVAKAARYLQREGTSSYETIKNTVQAIAKLHDYYLLVHGEKILKPGEMKNLLEDFLFAVDHGTVLGWHSVSNAEFGAIRASVLGYVKYLLEQSVDWPTNGPDHQFLYACKTSFINTSHVSKSLLFHTKKRPRKKNKGRKKAAAGLRIYKPFPPQYINDLILLTRNPRDQLLLSLLAFGGRRISEMLHLFSSDLEVLGNDLKVHLRHPTESRMKWRNLAGAELKGKRSDYLKTMFKSLPRTEHGALPTAVGWKGIKFDDEAALESQIYFIQDAGSKLVNLHRSYLHNLRPMLPKKHHPYHFVSLDGEPLTLSAVEKQFSLACRRVEKKHGISLKGFGIHSLRHYYGFYCADRLGASLLMIQKWMGHMQLSSTAIYAHISPSTANAALREAEHLANADTPQVVESAERADIKKRFREVQPFNTPCSLHEINTTPFGEIDTKFLKRRIK